MSEEMIYHSYYIFSKGDEYITISGDGDNPHNLGGIWITSSSGATKVADQLRDLEFGYSPQIGFIKFSDYPNDIYIQVARFQTIYKNGWRFRESNI